MKNKLLLTLTAGAVLMLGSAFVLWGSRAGTNTTGENLLLPLTADLRATKEHVERANTPNIPENWVAYRLTTFDGGLTIRHPQGLLIHKSDQEGTTPRVAVNFIFNTPDNRSFLNDGSGGQPPGMQIAVLRTGIDSEAYMKARTSQPHTNATLFGKEAIVYTGQGMDRWDVILFSRNNNLYEITIEYGSIGDELHTAFYRMLSSLVIE